MKEITRDARTWVTVHNVPMYHEASDYMVARAVNGELWYYGTYPTKERAEEVITELAERGSDNAIIIH